MKLVLIVSLFILSCGTDYFKPSENDIIVTPIVEIVEGKVNDTLVVIKVKFINTANQTFEYPLIANTFILKVDKEPHFIGDTGLVGTNYAMEKKSINLEKDEEAVLEVKFNSERFIQYKKHSPNDKYQVIYRVTKVTELDSVYRIRCRSINSININ